jgi:hypothetical protein
MPMAGQFYIRGGLHYRCELTDGKAVECTQNHECRAHVAGSLALPLPRRTLQGCLGAAAPAQARPSNDSCTSIGPRYVPVALRAASLTCAAS